MTVPAVTAERLAKIASFVIDMDGVLYRGDAILPHVNDFIDALEARPVPYVMCTNNSTRTPQEYTDRLAEMGLTVPADRVVTSGIATRSWLDAHYPAGTRIYVVGAEALFNVVYGDAKYEKAGVDAEVVVTGADFDLTFEKMRVATLAIRRGAAWVATNPDTTFPTEEGLIPGAGALVAAIAAATSVKPTIIGKPEPGMLLESAHILGTPADSTAMLGDRLDTDILAGKAAGFITVLVLTGVTSASDLTRSSIQPDITFPDLEPLVEYYGSHD